MMNYRLNNEANIKRKKTNDEYLYYTKNIFKNFSPSNRLHPQDYNFKKEEFVSNKNNLLKNKRNESPNLACIMKYDTKKNNNKNLFLNSSYKKEFDQKNLQNKNANIGRLDLERTLRKLQTENELFRKINEVLYKKELNNSLMKFRLLDKQNTDDKDKLLNEIKEKELKLSTYVQEINTLEEKNIKLNYEISTLKLFLKEHYIMRQKAF